MAELAVLVLMVNRLGDSTSPYLLQHKDNPVDWHEWDDQAFAEARERNVPILLSVGYSACHWCHVMAHESFEDDTTAALMNERYVNVKVDREERPDVDAVYMNALTAMTGHGGWPMTVFLTADGAPFYAGTYFPPQRRAGSPAFRDVLIAVSDTWRERADEVATQADNIVQRLSEAIAGSEMRGQSPPSVEDLQTALGVLTRHYDYARGGFGSAPKFPPSMVLEFLIRHHARTGSADALLMAERTMRAMACGGMYDQLGGGFARYSVDADWVVPHFEKMLYDNALLARVAVHLWRSTGRPLGRRIAEETADFMVSELLTAEGGFASALDADTEGVEGRFYVWNPAQLVDALGNDDGEWAASVFNVTVEGTFEEGFSTLQLLRDPEDDARLASVRQLLLEARSMRARPQRDDKVVTSWNGLAIAALAEIGALLDRPDLIDAARRAAELLLGTHVVDGKLRRASRDGVVGRPAGVLDDYANVTEGLLALYNVTSEPRWYLAAEEFVAAITDDFADGHGGLYDTSHDAERLVQRPQDPTDNATPSGQSAAAGALLSYAALSGDASTRDVVEELMTSASRLASTSPRFAGWWLAVAEAWHDGPREVAIVGGSADQRDALRDVALESVAPGLVVAVHHDQADPVVPLLQHRPLDVEPAVAYVCRNFSCQAPTTEVSTLTVLLRSSTA